jgi:hypothetical protein
MAVALLNKASSSSRPFGLKLATYSGSWLLCRKTDSSRRTSASLKKTKLLPEHRSPIAAANAALTVGTARSAAKAVGKRTTGFGSSAGPGGRLDDGEGLGASRSGDPK